MPISEVCQDLIFTNFAQSGYCLTEFVFFGDLSLSSLIILALVVIVGVRTQLPLEVMFPALMGFTFVLWMLSGAVWLLGLFLIGLVLAGALMGLKFLELVARG